MGMFNQKKGEQNNFVKLPFAKIVESEITVNGKAVKQPLISLFETSQRRSAFGDKEGYSTLYNKSTDKSYWFTPEGKAEFTAEELPGKYTKILVCIDSEYEVFILPLSGTNLASFINAHIEGPFVIEVSENEITQGRTKIVHDKLTFSDEKGQFDFNKIEHACIRSNLRLWLIQKSHPAADLSHYNLIPADDLEHIFGKE